MSKKDYEAVARAVYRVRSSYPVWSQQFDGTTPHSQIVAELALVFGADNPRFDRGRFLETCKTGKVRARVGSQPR